MLSLSSQVTSVIGATRKNKNYLSSNCYTLRVLKEWEADQKLFGNPGKNQWVRSGVMCSTNFTEAMLDTGLCLAFEPSILAPSAGNLVAALGGELQPVCSAGRGELTVATVIPTPRIVVLLACCQELRTRT